MDRYDCLKIENQLCFPLYACSKEIIRKYKPFLDRMDLTYTQYITMMILWENDEINVKDLGAKLFLDSGTLTPLLKKLEVKGYLTRIKNNNDERNLVIKLTKEGVKLKDEAIIVPQEMGKCINISEQDAKDLYRILYTILNSMEGE